MTLHIFLNNNELLLSLCSESAFNFWSFKEQILSVNLTTYDDSELVINVETDTVRLSPLFLKKNFNICKVVIQDMHEILNFHNEYYILPKDFSDLMKLSEKYYSSYYGSKKYYKRCSLFFRKREFFKLSDYITR